MNNSIKRKRSSEEELFEASESEGLVPKISKSSSVEEPSAVNGSVCLAQKTSKLSVAEEELSAASESERLARNSSIMSLEEIPSVANESEILARNSSIMSLKENPSAANESESLARNSSMMSLAENPSAASESDGLARNSSIMSLEENPSAANESESLAQNSSMVSLAENPSAASESEGLDRSSSIISLEENNPSTANEIRDEAQESPDPKKGIQEKYFNLLFSEVLKFIKPQLCVDDDEIYNAAVDIINAFKNFIFMEINFHLPKNLCAYFYRWSLLNAATSRNRILYAFNNCQELRNCLESPKINVMSLGGGPGTDMIGFCSVIQEFISEDRNKQFDLTIVDLYESWGSFYNIIEFFIREKKFGNTFREKHSVNSSFMTVDLRDKNPPLKYSTSLMNADIILLVRVLYMLNFDEVNTILKNIVSPMKKGALLLLVDCDARFQVIPGLERIHVGNLKLFELTFRPDRQFNMGLADSSKAQIAVFRK